MLSYRVILDVPLPLVVFVPRLLGEHRREIGTRDGTRALTCWKQAVFALAWFRDRPDIRRLGQGFGISQATAYRYRDEAVGVLAAKAPTLREAMEKAVEQGLMPLAEGPQGCLAEFPTWLTLSLSGWLRYVT